MGWGETGWEPAGFEMRFGFNYLRFDPTGAATTPVLLINPNMTNIAGIIP